MDLGVGNIRMLLFGASCEDSSKLWLMPSKYGYTPKKDPHPGLDGPKGKLFRVCLQIVGWVLKHNPDCEIFGENVVFTDMSQHWDEVCAALGPPLIVNSQDFSYTKRNRVYWHNFSMLQAVPAPWPRMDPNECMDTGRKLQTYTVYGRECVRPIGKSWTGDPNSLVADTSLPVLVDDDAFSCDQHLRPREAEHLMGMPSDCTAGNGVTAMDRLKAIGNGWDLNVTSMLLSHSALVQGTVAADDDAQHTWSTAAITQ
jgi:hypothetical protein